MTANEKYLNKYPKSISIEAIEIILKQMRNSICKICLKNGKKGTGFLCKIPFAEGKKILTLITNNHIINQEYLNKEKTINGIFDNNKTKKINLKNKRIYTNKDYDITIIEIKQEDEIKENCFLEIDDIKKDKSSNGYIGNTIYILHYPIIGNEQKLSMSLGIIKENSLEKDFEFNHLCSTDSGSFGAPIINSSNNKVIGIHKLGTINKNYNVGAYLNNAIEIYKDLFKKELMIKKDLKNSNMNDEKIANNINKLKDGNNIDNKKNANNLNNVKIKYKINKDYKSNKIKIFGDAFVRNNRYKISFIFNGKEKELLEPYLELDSDDLNKNYIEITLKTAKIISNMSYIFSGCDLLSPTTDFSNWNTYYVTNMSYMFYGCEFLEELPNISYFNTNKVKDMSFMFSGCKSLKKIPDISSWNTSNVTNMSNMFSYCSSLKSLPENISNWNINRVKDLNCMFYQCSSLEYLPDISLWNVNNVKDMSFMFYYCKSLLKLPELERWNIEESTKISGIFSGCSTFLKIPEKLEKF